MVRCRTQRPEPIRALGLRQLHRKSGNFVRTIWNRATKHEADPKGVGHRWHECDLGGGDFRYLLISMTARRPAIWRKTQPDVRSRNPDQRDAAGTKYSSPYKL